VRRLLPALLGALLALLAPAAADAKTVRAFAVGPKFSLDWVESRSAYHDKLFALMDSRRRGGGAPSVQRGADDVASHLRTDKANLVTLPEDVGLMAAFTGTRGSGARSSDGLVTAIVALLGSYAPVSAYYTVKYPSLASRPLPTRALALALTDTFGRAALETYAEFADRYDVHLEAGVNMAQDWRIVCVSKASYKAPPGGEPCAKEDPALVAQLRSPDEPTRDYAYEATTSEPVNMALVFGPDGKLISKQVKTYLTPSELPDQLDLVPGEVSRGLSAVKTPVGTLGFVTSKDSWMPDVTAKLDAAGVDVLVQPEFFAGDTISARPGMWAADNIKASGYSDVLRHPSMEALLLPELTGNVFDFSADNQQQIAIKPRQGRLGGGYLVGQESAPGWLKVGPYAVKDPERRGESIAARRARLGRAGDAMLSTSTTACPSPTVPGPCRGGQVEGVVWADIEVARKPKFKPVERIPRVRGLFGVNRPIASTGKPQRNVSLAASKAAVFAAFEQAGRVVVSSSILASARAAGLAVPWSPPRTVARGWWPSIATGPDGRVWLAWQDADARAPRVYVAVSTDDGRTFSSPRTVDASPPKGVAQWRPSIAATGNGSAYVAWIDERERSEDDDLPQAHLYGTRLRANGTPVARGVKLDGGTPAHLAEKLDNAWAPDVTARGKRVAVTWIDFRTYDWRAYLRTSSDGGASFAAERVVTDAPSGATDESLDDTPRVALDDKGNPFVAFTDYRKRDTSRRPHQLYDIYLGRPGAKNVQVDPWGTRQLNTFAPAVAFSGSSLYVVWQDASRGVNDIRLRRVTAAGKPAGRTVRVEDKGAGGGNSWRPDIVALGAESLLVAWEDERDGPPQIFVATGLQGPLR
jgi:hypothetical protein